MAHGGFGTAVSTRVDRLLKQRQMKRSQSMGTLTDAAAHQNPGVHAAQTSPSPKTPDRRVEDAQAATATLDLRGAMTDPTIGGLHTSLGALGLSRRPGAASPVLVSSPLQGIDKSPDLALPLAPGPAVPFGLASRTQDAAAPPPPRALDSKPGPSDPLPAPSAGLSFPPTPAGAGQEPRLLVVANRLPVTAFKGIGGDWKLQMSSGGLVSALTGVEGYDITWVGWPGHPIAEEDQASLTAALAKRACVPVYLDEDTTELYYDGYCNSVLWQLFHYIALEQDTQMSDSQTMQKEYAAYKKANALFVDTVMSVYRPNDIVWIHDYHLMLMPSLLKHVRPEMKVGWFLHTPFPSSEIVRTMPQRDDILMGVLSADLVGFHTYDYARHFVSSVTRILGLEGTLDGIENAHMGTVTRVAVFPIGIDPDRWTDQLEKVEVQHKMLEMRHQFDGKKVLLGVDRLDMVKGIPQKLLAYEKFLEDNEEWRHRVVLVQIAIPSRKNVPEYQRLTRVVHEMAGRINGRFGSLTSNPIHYLDCSLDANNLCALYAVTDVLMVSSLRDGMNLVSYEYVACQNKDDPGVLILSEFAGAAQSLGAGAILMNPWNVNELARAIAYALTMGDAERQQRHRQNFMHVKVHTAQAWGETFISELHDTHIEAALRTVHIPPRLDLDEVVGAFRASGSKLLVMGYNATLTTSMPASVPLKHRQFDQIRTLTQASPAVKATLNAIASEQDTVVVVVSGSERRALETTFEGCDVWLAAENGIFLKPPGAEWEGVVENVNLEWMESVQLVFDYFCERTPRSYVETRETSLVWNFKYADIEFGRNQMRDMLQHLWTGAISNAQVEILRGAKSVEARPLGVTKGRCVQRILDAVHKRKGHFAPDFVLCAGHFMHRDEDLFSYFDNGGKDVGGCGSSVEGDSPKDHAAATNQGGAGPPGGTQGSGAVEVAGGSAREWPGSAGEGPGCFPNSPIKDLKLCSFFPKHVFTVTVGRKHSQARRHLKASDDIAALLDKLVATRA